MFHQFAQGPANDLRYQTLINKNTVKKDINTNITPLRNKSNLIPNHYNKQNVFNNQTLPNQISKTALKKNTSMQKPLTCVNHQDRTAQYSIQIDDQVMNYCNKCAAHLASQGFEVQKIAVKESDRILTNPTPPKNRMVSPNNFKMRQSQSKGNQRRSQLQNFMNEMEQLRQAYKNKKDFLRKVSQSYEVQKQTVNNYFSSMIQYLEYLRDDYIQEIQDESVKNTQICEIQAGQITQTLSEVDEMLIDIDGNIDNIVEQIDEQNYVQCFSYYRQKQGIFEHRLQELGTDAKPWSCTSNEQIEQKLDNFKQFMDELMQQ